MNAHEWTRWTVVLLSCFASVSCATTPLDDEHVQIESSHAALITSFDYVSINGTGSIPLRPVSTDICWLTGVAGSLDTPGNWVVLDTSTGTWLIAAHMVGEREGVTVSAKCANWSALGIASADGSFYAQAFGASSAYRSMTGIYTWTNWGYLSGFGAEFRTNQTPNYTYAEVSRYSGLGLAVNSGNFLGVSANAVFVRGTHRVSHVGQWTSTNTSQLLGQMSNSVCYLTGLGAAENHFNVFDGAFIEPDSATGRWKLRVFGGAFARAECIEL